MILDFRLTIVDWVTQGTCVRLRMHFTQRPQSVNFGRPQNRFNLCETLCLGAFVAFFIIVDFRWTTLDLGLSKIKDKKIFYSSTLSVPLSYNTGPECFQRHVNMESGQ